MLKEGSFWFGRRCHDASIAASLRGESEFCLSQRVLECILERELKLARALLLLFAPAVGVELPLYGLKKLLEAPSNAYGLEDGDWTRACSLGKATSVPPGVQDCARVLADGEVCDDMTAPRHDRL